jgi:hypothetical protein
MFGNWASVFILTLWAGIHSPHLSGSLKPGYCGASTSTGCARRRVYVRVYLTCVVNAGVSARGRPDVPVRDVSDSGYLPIDPHRPSRTTNETASGAYPSAPACRS